MHKFVHMRSYVRDIWFNVSGATTLVCIWTPSTKIKLVSANALRIVHTFAFSGHYRKRDGSVTGKNRCFGAAKLGRLS